MDLKEDVAAHNLDVSIFKIERVVRSDHPLATAIFDVLA